MGKLWNGLFKNRNAAYPFIIAVGLCVVAGGPASAQQTCSTQASPGWTIDNPSLEDQRDIADVLSGYAWAIDDWDVPSFVALFLPDVPSSYELCNVKEQVFKLLRNGTGLENLQDEMADILDNLKFNKWKTRHSITNTMYDKQEDGTVKTKSTVLVTIQIAGKDVPEIDYSAETRATLAKDKNGDWKFQSLTVYADNGPAVPAKR